MAHNLGRRRPARRPRPAPGDRRDPAAQGLHHARPARPLRPTTTPTTTGELALGRPGPPGPDPHHRDPAALLNATPTPTTRSPEKPADRQLNPARPHISSRRHNRPTAAPHPPRSTVDPGLAPPSSSATSTQGSACPPTAATAPRPSSTSSYSPAPSSPASSSPSGRQPPAPPGDGSACGTAACAAEGWAYETRAHADQRTVVPPPPVPGGWQRARAGPADPRPMWVSARPCRFFSAASCPPADARASSTGGEARPAPLLQTSQASG